MFFTSSIFFVRIAFALAASILAYFLWRYIRGLPSYPRRENASLVAIYLGSRLGLWLIFTVYLQRYVTTSDPRLFYTRQLEHFLAGDTPIRDFYYPYGPLLMPSMLPLYLLSGHSLAGI